MIVTLVALPFFTLPSLLSSRTSTAYAEAGGPWRVNKQGTNWNLY